MLQSRHFQNSDIKPAAELGHFNVRLAVKILLVAQAGRDEEEEGDGEVKMDHPGWFRETILSAGC